MSNILKNNIDSIKIRISAITKSLRNAIKTKISLNLSDY